MSNMRIVGGNQDTPVRVSYDGKMVATSTCWSPIQMATFKGDAFHLLAETTLTDSSITPMLWVQNDDTVIINNQDRLMVIDGAVFSADADVHFETFLDETYTSGGGTAKVMNLHRGMPGKDAPVTAKDGSTALVLGNDGTEVMSSFVGGSRPHTNHLGFFLPKGKTLSIRAQGANTNQCRVEFIFYFVPVDPTC